MPLLERLQRDPDFVDLHTLSVLSIDLKYASLDNFMGKNVYGDFNRAFLHRHAAEKLLKAAAVLRLIRPDWRLLVLDALRPRSVQRVLWKHVQGTGEEQYVAHPDRGSVHNYGLAVDLTCIDETGAWVEMGSGFDCFLPISQPCLEKEHLQSGALTQTHLDNRHVLRGAMTEAGFHPIPNEWWHFDALHREEIRDVYRIIE